MKIMIITKKIAIFLVLIFLMGSSAMKYVKIVAKNESPTMKYMFPKIDSLPSG